MDTFTLTAWQRRRLQRQLRAAHDARLFRRALAVLDVARGESVAATARRLGVTPRVIYYWLRAYARDYDPAALRDGDRPGRPPLLTAEDRERLRELLLGWSPQDLGYAATDWTVPLLREHLAGGTGRRPSDDTIRRELGRQGFVWKRCRYALDPDPQLRGKKAPPAPAYPAVPAPAVRLVAPRPAQAGGAQRPQRPAGGLRGDEPADGPAPAVAAGAPAGRRLPGVPAGGALLLPGLARGAARGRGPLPHRHGVGRAGRLVRHRAAVAAEAVAAAEPDGHAVGPGQGRHQRGQAVRDHRRAGRPLRGVPGKPVSSGSVTHSRGVLHRLLVKVRLVKRFLRTCLEQSVTNK